MPYWGWVLLFGLLGGMNYLLWAILKALWELNDSVQKLRD
jgi:hypothetical protein